jgi:hypothetical protein
MTHLCAEAFDFGAFLVVEPFPAGTSVYPRLMRVAHSASKSFSKRSFSAFQNDTGYF